MTSSTSTRRATAADVARDVGVSRATVGYVLNDTPGQTISPSTRERVLDSARRLGYRPRAAARALASGHSHLVLLVLPDWPLDYSVRKHIEEASQILDDAGYTLVTWTPHAGGRTRPLWELLDPDVVIGFAAFDEATVDAMRAHGIRSIIPEPGDAPSGAAVGRGPALQVEHLHALGHRRIALATTADPRLAELARERIAVAQETAEQLGVRLLAPIGIDARGVSPDDVIRSWTDDGATGVVAYNDDVAARVVGAAVRAGFDVPRDLSVVGHDDSPLASLFLPPLTSIAVDNAAVGRLFAELALASVEQRQPALPETDVVESLIARASTCAARTGTP